MALLFVVFTVFATMGTGEHYLIDLVVAFPFALFLQGLASIRVRPDSFYWLPCVLIGALATGIWLVLLKTSIRIMWITPAIPWTLITLTVVGTLLLNIRLQRLADTVDLTRRDNAIEC